MQAKLLSWINGIAAWWKNLDSRRKITYSSAAGLVVLSLGILIFVLAMPSREVLVRATDSGELQEIRATLRDRNIRYWVDGLNVIVNEGDLFEAQQVWGATNRASITNFHWADALDASGLTASRAVIDQSMILATTTRIEQQMTAFVGVLQAQVILDIPSRTNNFFPTGEEPTASVTLTVTPTFNRNSGDALARTVQRSVIGLELENIFIVDQNANVIFSGEETSDGFVNLAREMQAAYTAQMQRGVREILAPITTGGRVVVTPSLTFDWTVVHTEMINHANPLGLEAGGAGLLALDHIMRMSSTFADAGGEPGMAAVDMTIPVYLGGMLGAGEMSQLEHIRQFLHDVTHTVTQDNRAGALITDESSVAVHISNDRTFFESSFNAGYYDHPPGITWQQFQEVNANPALVDVDPQLLGLVQAATGISNVAIVMSERPLFVGLPPSAIQLNEVLILVLLGLFILMLAYGLLKRNRPDDITELEPELAVEDLLVSTQIEEERERELLEEERYREIQIQQDSEIKQMIEKFIDLRPEAAAQLLRNWLNEDWD